MAIHRTSRNPKIDNQATDGLAGVHNSLAYRVHEIEKHIHNDEDWFCLAAVPDGEVHVADNIAGATAGAPFQIDAGNDAWGDWVQLLGSTDTPARSGSAKFDLHKIQIVDSEETSTHTFVQISAGETDGVGISGDNYTTVAYLTPTNQAAEAAISFMQKRQNVGTKMWARCWAIGKTTMTLDFYFGLHEYSG